MWTNPRTQLWSDSSPFTMYSLLIKRNMCYGGGSGCLWGQRWNPDFKAKPQGVHKKKKPLDLRCAENNLTHSLFSTISFLQAQMNIHSETFCLRGRGFFFSFNCWRNLASRFLIFPRIKVSRWNKADARSVFGCCHSWSCWLMRWGRCSLLTFHCFLSLCITVCVKVSLLCFYGVFPFL